MKIGKLTFDGYNNYGNTLQNYALQEFLANYADTVETLWHTPEELISEYWKWDKKQEIKFLLNYRGYRKDLKNGQYAWEFARRVEGLAFQQKYINIRYDITDLRDVIDEYDYFVVGSDQVWNPYNPRLQTAFLDFSPKHKRVSYAASIGAITIPNHIIDSYREGILGMEHISVREERAAEIIRELTGKEVEVVLDPVFCIEKQKWNSIGIKPYWLQEERYLFAYFLGSIPKIVVDFAKKNNYKVINCFDKNNINHYIISPEEWVYLISHASYVITDSFHATAFSIIFGTPFYVLSRKENDNKKQMITRINSLLKMFHLESRLIEDIDSIKNDWDYSYMPEPIIKEELTKSKRFIERAFS